MLSRCGMALIAICMCGRLLAAEQIPGAHQPPTESSAKRIALTEEQIARGQAIRNLLVLGIDFARDHGEWPKDLSELKADRTPPLTYLGPPARLNNVERHTRGELQAVSPVCHESLTAHHDGAWIGYADGHVEFVHDDGAMRSALEQSEPARIAMEKLKPRSASAGTPAAQPEAKLAIKLLDEARQPIEGAQVGGFLWNADYDRPQGRGRLSTLRGDKVSPQETTSDAQGRVEVQYQWFFDDDDPPDSTAAMIAYHKERGLISIATIEPKMFQRASDAAVPSTEVKLQAGVRVNGSLSRIGAPPPAGESMWTNAYVYVLSGGRTRPMSSMSKQQAFNFLLPPGDYLLHAYGDGAYNTFRFLRLTGHTTSIQLHLDLPPDRLAALTGQPAPELRQIKDWKNGGPLALQQLRGKWVVLDFWGYWCGPCVGSMPELMKLHDEFGDKGLVVIAVHDDSVESIKELDKNLEKTRQGLWKGRDLPFLVALDGGGELPISGTERSTSGATHAAYGVQHWPTTILIDPQGNAVGERDPSALRELLEKELKSTK